MPKRNWRDHAACRSEDPDLFFPVGTSGPALRQLAEAQAVCAHCPVAAACLQWAMTTKQADGVWGGRLMSITNPSSDDRLAEKEHELGSHGECGHRGCKQLATATGRCGTHSVRARRASLTCSDGHPYQRRPNGWRHCPVCRDRYNVARRYRTKVADPA
jgi:WhiB family redox-sensing transcriptional regulator